MLPLDHPSRIADLRDCLRHDAEHARRRAELATEAADALEAAEAVNMAAYARVAARAVVRAGLATDAADKVDVVLVALARLWPWHRRLRFAVALLSPWWPRR